MARFSNMVGWAGHNQWPGGQNMKLHRLSVKRIWPDGPIPKTRGQEQLSRPSKQLGWPSRLRGKNPWLDAWNQGWSDWASWQGGTCGKANGCLPWIKTRRRQPWCGPVSKGLALLLKMTGIPRIWSTGKAPESRPVGKRSWSFVRWSPLSPSPFLQALVPQQSQVVTGATAENKKGNSAQGNKDLRKMSNPPPKNPGWSIQSH